MKDKIIIYLKSILLPVAIGALVGIVISKFIDYNSLNKPFLSPPSIVFPIVWTILYVLMGISYGILKSNGLADEKINLIYYTQLIINALWSVFFFIFKWRFFSIIWTVLLVVAVVNMIINFYDKNKTSGLLQIPYLIWTIFATYLTLGVYILN